MRKQVVSACIVLAFLMIAITVVRRRQAMDITDPLKGIGLPEKEILLYRYLTTLETLSTYGRTIPHHTSVEGVRDYITHNPVAQCVGTSVIPGCGRWFLAEVSFCPFCHAQTNEVSHAVLQDKINEWETFRIRYRETSHIRGLTRVGTVKLHYYLAHPEQG